MFLAYIINMNKKGRSSLLKQLDQKDFLSEIADLWPAAGGSLSLVRKPCVRPGCPACAKGIKHASYILMTRDEVSRRCMYVPKELAPVLREAMENGKKVDKLMSRMAVRMIMAWRDKRGKKARRPK
jgi:hypothetical protein